MGNITIVTRPGSIEHYYACYLRQTINVLIMLLLGNNYKQYIRLSHLFIANLSDPVTAKANSFLLI